jgi:hypothetical protein
MGAFQRARQRGWGFALPAHIHRSSISTVKSWLPAALIRSAQFSQHVSSADTVFAEFRTL